MLKDRRELSWHAPISGGHTKRMLIELACAN